MILILTLIICFLSGWRIVNSIRPLKGDIIVTFFTSIVTGSVILVWTGFALRFFITPFNKISIPLLIFQVVIFAVINKVFAVKSKIRIYFLKDWVLLTRIILLLTIAPLFFFGIRYDSLGNLIFTGNFIDFAYHLSISNAFIEQAELIPFHPQSSGNTIYYHFLANYLGSILINGGIDPINALIYLQRMSVLSLVILLVHFFRIINLKRQGLLFSSMFFLVGHIGVFNLFFSLFSIISSNVKNPFSSFEGIASELLFPYFNFLCPLHNCFSPQLPFLYGFPIVLIILSTLIRYTSDTNNNSRLIFATTLTAALPLIHIHSFLVVFPLICSIWFFYRHSLKEKVLFVFLVMFAVLQITFLFGANYPQEYSGWDVSRVLSGTYENKNFNLLTARIIFWIRVAGPTIILGIVSTIILYRSGMVRIFNIHRKLIIYIFILTQLVFFLIINFYRPTPNWGDVNKFFLYLHLTFACFFGIVIEKSKLNKLKIISVYFLLSIFTFPFFFDISRKFFNKNQSILFSSCEIEYAKVLKQWSRPTDIFLTSDDLTNFIPALSARQVFDGAYTINTGYSTAQKKEIVRDYYEGRKRLQKGDRIDYIFISHKERGKYRINKDFFLQNYNLVESYNCKGNLFEVYGTLKQ